MRLTVLLLLVNTLTAQQVHDYVIRGGRIVDGQGNPWFRADIGIRNGRIDGIGDLSKVPARRVIQLNGEFIAPGFIDMMGASSVPLITNPDSAASKLRQGITTIFAGEGSSPAPQSDDTFSAEAARKGFRWRTYAEYHAILEKAGIAVNVVHNVGAAQIRRIVMGVEDREPTPAELDKMKAHVDESMRAGAVGVSTALIYPPGTYAKTAELVELVKVAARYRGIYSTHMRNESAQLLEAIRESMEIGRLAGAPVHIYHLKAAGESNWPLMQKAVDLIQSARDRGSDVTADVYPYIRNGLGIGSLIMPHHYAKGNAVFLKTLHDPNVRRQLRQEIENRRDWENWYQHVGRDWDNILVATVPGGSDRAVEGKSVAEIARMWKKDEWDTFFDLVLKEASVNPKSMNEGQKNLAMRTEWVSFCTDAAPTPPTATGAHPRAFGSFPRILAKYVREDKVISLEMAIRKMTSLPANRLGLAHRGRIAPGMSADLVIFDPATVQDKASFTDPLAFPEGIPYVFVNGVLAVDQAKPTGVNGGKVLKPLLN
ncbi:MAG: D-aminoacylase [Acidobacteria bacterium]|nr:D-aminoacylase [Acidobacteriota bacterium]